MIPKNFITDSTLLDKDSMVGEVFHRLTCNSVAGYVLEKTTKRICYLFKCSCGNSAILRGRDVIRGATKSCGCLHAESSSLNGRKNKKEEPNDQPAFLRMYSAYQSSAKSKGFNFDLSKEHFRTITSSSCHYCGVKPSNEYTKGWVGYRSSYISNGVDRKDNDKGYTTDNSLPCCSNCNYAKKNYSYEDFQDWLQRITDFRTK